MTNFVFRMAKNIETVWDLNPSENPLENVLHQLSALYKDFDDDNLLALFNNHASTAKGQ